MSTLELIRRHAELRDAHATVLQSLKYPGTVAFSAVLAAHQPAAAAIEGGFYFKNAKVALVLGEVRGVAIVACAMAAVPVYEYSPRRAKQNITGWGAAPKEQVAKRGLSVLGLPTLPPADATDAFALALCHAQSGRGLLTGEPI